jgi:DNA-binding beta-propeller fold protein YncE
MRTVGIALVAALALAASALASTGSLTIKGCVADADQSPAGCGKTATGMAGAYSISITRDGKSVYVGDEPFFLGAVGDHGLVHFQRSIANGALGARECIAQVGQNADGCPTTATGINDVDAIAVSPDGKSVYTTSFGQNAIAAFQRNTTTGALTPMGCVGDATQNPTNCAQTAKGLQGVEAIAISRDGKSLYTAGVDNAVVHLQRNTTNGNLTPKGCVGEAGDNLAGCGKTAKGLEDAYALALSPDGRSLYAGASAGSTIAMFDRDTTAGTLTSRGCVGDAGDNSDGCAQTAKGLGGLSSLTVTDDGASLYATSIADNALIHFQRNTTNGALTPKGCVGAASDNPAHCTKTAKGLRDLQSLAISHDGKSVYAASSQDNAVARFERNTTNGAVLAAGCIGDTGHNPAGCAHTAKGLRYAQSMALSRDGTSLYAVGYHDSAVVHFQRSP